MFSPIQQTDFTELEEIISAAIRTDVAESVEEASMLVAEVAESLKKWKTETEPSFHRKHQRDGVVTGFIIVKGYWNLSHLFVRPENQGVGIGRELVRSAIEVCRSKSPRGRIELNSSQHAVGFYTTMGFQQAGPEHKGLGGCVPFEFVFDNG